MSALSPEARALLTGSRSTADSLTDKAFQGGYLNRDRVRSLLIEAYVAGWIDGNSVDETSPPDSFVPDIWPATDKAVTP